MKGKEKGGHKTGRQLLLGREKNKTRLLFDDTNGHDHLHADGLNDISKIHIKYRGQQPKMRGTKLTINEFGSSHTQHHVLQPGSVQSM